MGLHVVHHLTSAAAVPLGLLAWARERKRGSIPAGPEALEQLRFLMHAHPPRKLTAEPGAGDRVSEPAGAEARD